MRIQKKMIAAMLVAVAFTSCGDRFLIDDIDKIPKKRVDIVLTKAQQEMVPATREFTFDMVRNVVKNSEGNVFVSPFSLQAALALASVGANGQTRDEINTAIGLDGFQSSEVASFYRTLVPDLIGVDNTVDIAIANSVWAKESACMKASYKNIVENDFHASVHSLDGNPHQAINKWVNKSTKGMIKSLDVNTSDAAMLLLNAIYFNGRWNDPFDKGENSIDTFCDYSGRSIKVTFMNKTLHCGYYYGDVASAVSLPYGNGAYRMTIVIPTDERSSIDDVLDIMDDDMWKLMAGPVRYSPVSLSIPKFETEFSMDVTETMKSMGISRAFTEDADFSGMADKSLLISEIGQKARIKLDEKGTEASVVTQVVMGATSAGPEGGVFRFKADTPFFYTISEISTGTILFAGVQKWM